MRVVTLLAATTFLMIPGVVPTGTALAHHSLAGIYDMAEIGTVEGRLTKVDFVNPHVSFEVSVRGADGYPQIWKLESRSLRGMERAGLSASAVQVGAMVKFTGNPGRNGARVMWPLSLELGGATFDFRRRTASSGN